MATTLVRPFEWPRLPVGVTKIPPCSYPLSAAQTLNTGCGDVPLRATQDVNQQLSSKLYFIVMSTDRLKEWSFHDGFNSKKEF